MRKIVVSEFMTLDGVVEAPHEWSFDYWSDDIGSFKQDELFACDALLLGRITYEGFAEAWPGRTDEDGYADRINGLPKYVASRTVEKAEWNASVINENLAEELARAKQEPGQDILVFGSADLTHTLLQERLVDEFRLLVYPVVLGSGKRLIQDGLDKLGLKLVDTRSYDTGVVLLTYQLVS